MDRQAGRRPVDAALTYAGRGWAVFPCHHPTPGGCSCRASDCSSPAKHPRVTRGLHNATTDAAQIRSWWARWPDANVAVRTGEVSGIVVVDIDPDHGGEESLARLVSDHGALPPGRTVRTGSGGRHLYFSHPGTPVRNDAGRRLGPGIDIRGEGGYAIAPPSRHVSGARYTVASDGSLLPDFPAWLGDLLQRRDPPWRPPAPARDTDWSPSAWARAALDGELRRLRDATVGTRNHTLNRIAFRVGQIVGGGHLDEGAVEQALLAQAAVIGLGEREARATLHSGLRAGERQPRGPSRPAPNDTVEHGMP